MDLIESLRALILVCEKQNYDKDQIRHALAVWLLAHYKLDDIRDAVIGFEE